MSHEVKIIVKGPVGSGKTTIMDIIATKLKKRGYIVSNVKRKYSPDTEQSIFVIKKERS